MRNHMVKGMSCLLVAVYAMTYTSLFAHFFDHTGGFTSQADSVAHGYSCTCGHDHGDSHDGNKPDLENSGWGSESPRGDAPDHSHCICSILDFLEAMPRRSCLVQSVTVIDTPALLPAGYRHFCHCAAAARLYAPPHDTRISSPQISHLSTVVITC